MEYKQYEKLLQKVAHQYEKNTSLSYNECFAVMTEAYTRATQLYDEDLGKFSTLFCALARDFITEELRRHIEDPISASDFTYFCGHVQTPDEYLNWIEVLMSLDPDAIQLANETLNHLEFDGMESDLPKFRKAIRQHMRDLGWKDHRIRRAWAGIRQAVSS